MRSMIAAVFALALSLAATEASANVFLVTAARCPGKKPDRTLTGFKLKGFDGIVTALHGVIGCGTIKAVPDRGTQPLFDTLSIGLVDVENDVALLVSGELSNKYPTGLDRSAVAIVPNQKLQVDGHPLGLQYVLPSDLETRKEPVVFLRQLLPEGQTFNKLQQRLSPATSIQVISIQGTLLPGHSGAPIMDTQGRVIGVANGGLLNGSAQISWAVPMGNVRFTKPADNPILKQLMALDSEELFATADGKEDLRSEKAIEARLYSAIKQNDVESLKNALAAEGIPQQTKNEVLEDALYSNSAAMVTALANAGARLPENALCGADSKDPSSIRLFAYVRGVNVNYPCGNYGTPILELLGGTQFSTPSGLAARVDALLSLPGVDLGVVGNSSQTILIAAVESGDLATVEAVLKHGVPNINAKDYQGNTALHRAVRLDPPKSIAIVEALLRVKNINLNAIDEIDFTPADAACVRKNRQALRVLLSAGAKGKDNSGKELKQCLRDD